MKKLLFTLAAAATCGVAAAAPATATFDGATTFDPTKADDGAAISESNRGYWEIDVSTDPELTAVGEDKATPLGYLQINTGSTPLWRTFAGVDSHVSATNAALDAAAVDADGVVVSSDVKLTACTEWPTLTDFADEKLALFLFAPEEGDTSGKTAGLYAVGGAMVEGNLTATAYRLNAEPNAITNTDGWATIAIKSYADVYVNNTGAKYPAFVIAACAKGSATTNILSVATGEAYAPGYTEANLSNAAKARIEDRELIPSAKTSDGKLVGLGFQGEGGIDNVSLATTDFAVDAVTMGVSITGEATVAVTAGGTLDNGTITFNPGATVKFMVSSSADIVNVTYSGENALSYDENAKVYSVVAEADAVITVTASAAAFQIGEGAKYATLAEALAGLTSGSTLKLLGTLKVSDQISFADAENNPIAEVVLDLNGQTIEADGVFEGNLIYNVSGTKLTIIDSSAEKTGTVDGAVANEGELIINAGKFNGAVANDGTLTDNGGMFKETDGLPEVTGKEYRDDDSDGYYTLVDEAGSEPETPVVPSIPEGDGNVSVDEDGKATVEVDAEKEGDVVVTVPDGFEGVIAAVVPPTVTSISGVPAANITVKVGEVNITGAFTKTEDSGKVTLDLNPEGAVVIGEETINVKPDLADGAEETPFVVGDTTAATVKTIPGLKYSLVWDSDLSFTSDDASGVKGGTEPVRATSSRMTLTDDTPAAQKPTKRFYKVHVTK